MVTIEVEHLGPEDEVMVTLQDSGTFEQFFLSRSEAKDLAKALRGKKSGRNRSK